jgi:hypothetical protein
LLACFYRLERRGAVAAIEHRIRFRLQIRSMGRGQQCRRIPMVRMSCDFVAESALRQQFRASPARWPKPAIKVSGD